MSKTQSISREQRAEHRFPVLRELDLKVKLIRNEREDLEIEGVPSDLSPRGLKLLVNSTLGFDERITVHLDSESQQVKETKKAVVRWQRPVTNQENVWAIGLAFENSLSDLSIQKLAVSGGIERRTASRISLDESVRIQRNSSLERHEIKVLDASKSGLRINADQDFEVGDTIRINFEDQEGDFDLFGKVAWSQPATDGFDAGIQLRLAGSNGSKFSQWIERRQQPNANGSQTPKRITAIIGDAFSSLIASPLAKRR